mmetsp:Transcript_12921/g.23239  ORF Transcript_12921/g.23239 Transcript_12921/m.23239 type:complete len:188 (-) Transcript_12921:111-674(-)
MAGEMESIGSGQGVKEGRVGKRKYVIRKRTRDTWTPEECAAFENGLALHGRNWKAISKALPNRNLDQIRSHAQKHFIKQQRKSFMENDSKYRVKPESEAYSDRGIETGILSHCGSAVSFFDPKIKISPATPLLNPRRLYPDSLPLSSPVPRLTEMTQLQPSQSPSNNEEQRPILPSFQSLMAANGMI